MLCSLTSRQSEPAYASIKYLDIPIDQRLRRLIRETRPVVTYGGGSQRLQNLSYIWSFTPEFRKRLSNPIRPQLRAWNLHSSQESSGGFLAGKRRCASIDAESENVVISCFQKKTRNNIVEKLRCRGIGSSFDVDPHGLGQQARSGYRLSA